MSLIDPATRWWNNGRARRAAAVGCWAVALLGTGFGSRSLASGSTNGVAVIAATVSVPLLVGGFFLYHFSSSDQEFNPRALFFPIAGMPAALGIGFATSGTSDHGLFVTGVCFAGLALIALVVIEVATRVVANNERIRTLVERSGVKAQGTVTRAFGYYSNSWPMTRVTVRFTDRAGQSRWTSQSVGGRVTVGDRMTVTYSPQHVDRKAGVVISRK